MTPGDEIANFLIQERGYIVVGLMNGKGARGQMLLEFAGMPLSQPIVLVEPTDVADWTEQSRVAAPFQGKPGIRWRGQENIREQRASASDRAAPSFWRAISD